MLSFTVFLIALHVLSSAIAVEGRLVRYDLTLTWAKGAPNGQSREMIFINGQMPGPTLEFDEDDDAEIHVYNKMPQNTSIHWHGQTQLGTPWSDGVPGLTQKPIEPGQNFVYRFKASPAGTYWYHSHSRGTMLDGLYGAFFVRRKRATPGPWSLISQDPSDIAAMKKAVNKPNIVTISDWSYYNFDQYMQAQYDSGMSIFCTDSILINGKGSVNCPGTDYLIAESGLVTNYSVNPLTVNDKGCFPFFSLTEGPYMNNSHPERIPPGLQEGCVPYNGSREKFIVNPRDKWVSFNFINAATIKTPILSIDQHPMWVYEVDGDYIEPQLAQIMHMYAGMRYSVMVKLDKPAASYPLRVSDDGQTQVISTYASIQYQGAPRHGNSSSVDKPYLSYGGQPTDPSVVAFNTDRLPPWPANPPAQTADETYVWRMSRWNQAWQYTVEGNGTFPVDQFAYDPILYRPQSADTFNKNMFIRTKNGSWVDIVMQVGTYENEPIEFPHMMHKHTSKAWIIGADNGIWNYTDVADGISKAPHTFNLQNPNFRDTYSTTANGPSWIVIRYHSNNPGPWLFHCHIILHEAAGMAMAILDGYDVWPQVPAEYGPDGMGHATGRYRRDH